MKPGIGISSGGRRPVVLQFNYNARYLLGRRYGQHARHRRPHEPGRAGDGYPNPLRLTS